MNIANLKDVFNKVSATKAGNMKDRFDLVQSSLPKIEKVVAAMKPSAGTTQIKTLLPILKGLTASVTAPPSVPEFSEVKDDAKFTQYMKQLVESARDVNDPAKMAEFSHSLFVERLYIQLINGQIPITPSSPSTPNAPGEKCYCPEVPEKVLMEYLSKIKAQKPPLAIRFSDGGTLLNLEGKQIFTSMLYLDAKRQQTIQLLIEKINNVLKLSLRADNSYAGLDSFRK